MGAKGTITSVGYLTIRTTDLTRSIKDAVDVLGLRLVENTGSKAFLTAADSHHEIVYLQDEQNAVDHFAVTVDSVQELDAIRAKVDAAGYPIVSEGPIEDFVERGFAFVGPEGFTWQPYVSTPWRDAALTGGMGPNRFGHITYKARDPEQQVQFLIETFDMAISDRVGDGELYFLRCNMDHHGVGVMRFPEPGLHHHAWAAQSIVDLGRLGDRLARQSRKLIWGPLRHGAGNNIAAYFVEPSGGVVELYSDMEQIRDKNRPVHEWAGDDEYWANQWNGSRPDPSSFQCATLPFERNLRFSRP